VAVSPLLTSATIEALGRYADLRPKWRDVYTGLLKVSQTGGGLLRYQPDHLIDLILRAMEDELAERLRAPAEGDGQIHLDDSLQHVLMRYWVLSQAPRTKSRTLVSGLPIAASARRNFAGVTSRESSSVCGVLYVHAEHAEDHPACCRGGVDCSALTAEHLETHPARGEVVDEVDQMAQVAAKPVELPDDKRVTGPQSFWQAANPGLWSSRPLSS